MNIKTERFLEEITTLSKSLADARNATLEYWAPELPPITIAYAEIGQKLADEIVSIDPNIRSDIFRIIEEAMEQDDEELGTAVATGLIEGMVGRSARLGTWENVRAELGPLSRTHAEAWLES